MAKRSCRDIEKSENVDRISNLPDDVLVRILSLIPTEEAVATSFMSKRWKSLWTLLPNLDLDFVRFSRKFNALSLDDQKRRFLYFVVHVLSHRGNEPLHKLRLALDIAQFYDYTHFASLLVHSAMRCNCLTIDLDFTIQDKLLFPEYSELNTLPSFYKSFTSFNVVKLTNVKLPKWYDLLSKCPCLEELHLIHCEILSGSLELNAPESKVKCLVLQNCVGDGRLYLKCATVHIPTLLQLKFEGNFSTGYLSIHNSENLIGAEIKIIYCADDEYKLLCKLLKDLQNVKSLTLSSRNLEVLNTSGGITLLSPLYNLKHLTVKLGQADEELLGLIWLLRSSPCLETLSIDFHQKYQTDDELLSTIYNVEDEAVPQSHLLPSKCVAHLMKIKVEKFQGLKLEMEFVKIILQSSLCLKELVICINSRHRYLKKRLGDEQYKALKKKKAKTIKRLLACKPASPDAQILLK